MSHRTIRSTLIASTLLAAGLISGAAQAALVDRGGGLIYDTDLNVTWLADLNYAQTSGYDADGLMSWAAANTWAANLSYYDSVRNVTYDDWRLPTSEESCNGFFCTGSEMQHLFTEMGGTSGKSLSGSHDADYDLFSNLQATHYWSGTYWAYGGNAYAFTMLTGNQLLIIDGGLQTVMAVRSGDVAAVPEAQTYALMLAGLGLIGWRARRRG